MCKTWDAIDFVYGYSKKRECIATPQVLDSAVTVGLVKVTSTEANLQIKVMFDATSSDSRMVGR